MKSTRHHLKFVQREITKREGLLAAQLLRWRKLGYTPNPWQMLSRGYVRLMALRAAKRRLELTPQSDLITPTEEELFVDSDDRHDLSMFHVQVTLTHSEERGEEEFTKRATRAPCPSSSPWGAPASCSDLSWESKPMGR